MTPASEGSVMLNAVSNTNRCRYLEERLKYNKPMQSESESENKNEKHFPTLVYVYSFQG